MSPQAPLTRRAALGRLAAAPLLAAGATGGCAGPTSTAAEGPLVLWHAYRGAELAALAECVAAFSARAGAPGVRLVGVPYDAFPNKVQVAVPRGNGPDLFIFAHDRVGDWAAAGLLEPLGWWADAALLDPCFAPTVQALAVGPQLYGLPLAFKTLALYRNLDLVPEAPASTDALVASARAARARDPQVWGLGYELDSLYFHAPWLHGFGGAVFDPAAAEPDRLALDRPEAAASVAFARHLLREAEIVPPEATSALITALFRERRLAYVLSGPWFRGELAGHERWAVSPLPVVSATGLPARPFLGVEAALVSAHGRRKRAAFELARWLVGPEAARTRLLSGGQLVARREAYADPEAAADPFVQAFRAQAEAAVPLSNRAAMRAVWTPVKRALSSAVVHGADPAEALRGAQAAIERSLR